MKQNKLIRNTLTVVTALILAVSFILPASAEEATPSADLSVAALSAYIWRGTELSKESIVLQPSMTVGYKGFSANVWGNLDTDPHENLGVDMNTWNETDFTLAYGKDFGSVSAELGYIYYALEGADDTQELYLSLGLDTLLSPTLTIYRDFAQYPGWYLLLGISHTVELKENLALELAGSVSYLAGDNEDDYPEIDDDGAPTGDKFSGLHDGTISVSLPITVTEYVTVTPSIAYVLPLSSDAENRMEALSIEGDEKDFFYGGVTA
ncbi:MAG: TorF family putative porin, partial [Thermodesulfobacteriota bacterium]|nr:TorF family putative porin [Thermodesulfobacteriota bacterium]